LSVKYFEKLGVIRRCGHEKKTEIEKTKAKTQYDTGKL
jgi:hypothetical protein